MLLSRRKMLYIGVAMIALLGIALWAVGTGSMSEQAARDITVQQAHKGAVLGQLVLVDIRRPDEWALTGVGQGAVPLDMRRDDFQKALSALVDGDHSRSIALICAAGIRSARMAKQLDAAGFTSILNVPEGMTGSAAGPGWLRSNLPRVAWEEKT